MKEIFRCYILAFGLCSLTYSVHAQECPVGDVIFRTQAEVDQFAIDYPNCKVIEANLVIGGSDNIVDLSPIAHITEVHGDLVITKNALLETLEGMALTRLDGSLLVDRNENLNNLQGLEGLTRIGGDYEITYNSAEYTSVGLENVKILGRHLEVNISRDAVFEGISFDSIMGGIYVQLGVYTTSMSAMESPSYVGGKLYIYDSNLSDISVLSSLTSLGGLEIVDNDAPVYLSGLRNVEVIHGNVRFEEDGTSSYHQLESLREIKGDLSFWYLGSVDVGSMPALERVGGSFIFYKNNLTNNVNGISTLKYIGGDMRFENTGHMETIDGFNSLDTVAGSVVFKDLYYGFETFTGLNHIKYIGKDILFQGNIDIEGIGGFAALKEIGRNIALIDNDLDINITWPPQLQRVGGMEIRNNDELTALPDITAFEIGRGDIIIVGNSKIEEIQDFVTLDSLHGSLIIQFGPDDLATTFSNLEFIGGDLNLEYLNGGVEFPRLTSIGRNIRLVFLSGVTHLDFLSGIETVNGNLELRFIPLTTVSVLSQLITVHGNVALNLNKAEDLTGLEGLRHIGGSLIIYGCHMIRDLRELVNLRHVGSYVQIENNSLLESLEGLGSINPDSLDYPYGPDIRIKGNPKLADCAIELICAQLVEDGTELEILGNRTGCNHIGEVDCLDFGLSGVVFIDIDGDGIRDEREHGIPNMDVHVLSGNYSVKTDVNGRYIFPCQEGLAYEFMLGNFEDEWLLTTWPATYNRLFIVGDTVNNTLHFGLQPKSPSRGLEINVSSGPTRCNSQAEFKIRYANVGTVTERGEILFELDELTVFKSASPFPQSLGEGKYRWRTDSIYPYESNDISITIGMPTEQLTGEEMGFDYSIAIDSIGVFIPQQESTYQSVVLCSYDPNDKLVNPMRDRPEHYTLKSEELSYVVRFQNTGNTPAIDVRIIDTLDAKLDVSTFEVINSSDPVITTLEGNVVHFFFKNIWLPDSISNPVGSQGFVAYAIQPFPGLDDFEEIQNTAHIIFDANPAITTNTTRNILVEALCTSSMTMFDTSLCAGQDYMGYSETVTLIDSFEVGLYCDSIHTTHIRVIDLTERVDTVNKCIGNYFFTSNDYFMVYSDTMLIDTIRESGCNKEFRYYTVIANQANAITVDKIICEGSHYLGYSTAGTHVILDYNGSTACFDTLHLALTVLPFGDPGCVDSDNDGSILAEDCDDLDPNVHPGAIDVPDNGIDEDCDGSDLSVSVQDVAGFRFFIYPNPAHDLLNVDVSYPQHYRIRLVHASGVQVYEGWDINRIDISTLPAGMYFIELKDMSSRLKVLDKCIISR